MSIRKEALSWATESKTTPEAMPRRKKQVADLLGGKGTT